MAERHSDDWHRQHQGAVERVREAGEGGYSPTAIDLAMANGNFDVKSGGSLEVVYFGSTPPGARPMAKRSIDGPQLKSNS